uniref:Uncharacterized protein n=1 Tax=Caulobacter phage BL57 TaxID=3348355 RepID=A0AB74UNR3_9VIRU
MSIFTPDMSTHDQAVVLGIEIIKSKPEHLTAYEAVQKFQHQSPASSPW